MPLNISRSPRICLRNTSPSPTTSRGCLLQRFAEARFVARLARHFLSVFTTASGYALWRDEATPMPTVRSMPRSLKVGVCAEHAGHASSGRTSRPACAACLRPRAGRLRRGSRLRHPHVRRAGSAPQGCRPDKARGLKLVLVFLQVRARPRAMHRHARVADLQLAGVLRASARVLRTVFHGASPRAR